VLRYIQALCLFVADGKVSEQAYPIELVPVGISPEIATARADPNSLIPCLRRRQVFQPTLRYTGPDDAILFHSMNLPLRRFFIQVFRAELSITTMKINEALRRAVFSVAAVDCDSEDPRHASGTVRCVDLTSRSLADKHRTDGYPANPSHRARKRMSDKCAMADGLDFTPPHTLTARSGPRGAFVADHRNDPSAKIP
jgi:hypothetical protein